MDNQQKQIILQMRKQNMTYAEIADYLGLPLNTVKSFCYRSRSPDNADSNALYELDGIDSSLCRNCGALLNQPARGRRKIFCSDRCRYAWWNCHRHKKAYHLICEYCGREFISCGNKNRRFCSRGCYQSSRYDEESP